MSNYHFLNGAEIFWCTCSSPVWPEACICKASSLLVLLLKYELHCLMSIFIYFLFMCLFLMQESPTPSKLIAPFSHGLSESRRSKLTVERHRVLSLLFLDPLVRFWSSLWYFDDSKYRLENIACLGHWHFNFMCHLWSLRCIFDVQENYEFLSRCIKEDLGFKDGKPLAACIIYKCLLQWHAFESERTEIFDFIIEGVNEVLKVFTCFNYHFLNGYHQFVIDVNMIDITLWFFPFYILTHLDFYNYFRIL